MKVEEIEVMEAGRELDALIAIEFFELIVNTDLWITFETVDGDFKPLRPYSTDISASWQVVEHMQSNYSFEIRAEGNYVNPKNEVEVKFGGFTEDYVRAETAPLAICRAALVVVMENAK